MGTLRGDNGGGERPQEGGGLPDLPPEWGTIIIPEDAAALDVEGASVRRQFRRARSRRRWRRRLHLTPEPARRTTDDSPGLAVPLLIMSIAVIATLVSLFAVAWPDQRPRTPTHVSVASPAVAISVARISLLDPTGVAVSLRDLAPAVILLVEGCSCETLITGTVNAVAATEPSTAPSTGDPTAAAAGPGAPSAGVTVPVAGGTPATRRTNVLVLSAIAPTLPAGLTATVPVRALADPNSSLRAAVPELAIERTTAAILIGPDGLVIRAVRFVTSADDFADSLSALQH